MPTEPSSPVPRHVAVPVRREAIVSRRYRLNV
ncbi:hypothetical protein EDD25_3022 [Cryobacterium psychrophilum]|nr:hypothetical protein EDD25_3022 [Cryobacterium psychrophilum]